MTRNTIYQAAISVFLLGFMSMQALTSFGLTHPTRYWPFLSYPMYNNVHHAGDMVPMDSLVGVIEGGQEIPISEDDLSLTFWQYLRGPIRAVREQNRTEFERYVGGWEKQHGTIIEARVKSQPVGITERGTIVGPPELVTLTIKENRP